MAVGIVAGAVESIAILVFAVDAVETPAGATDVMRTAAVAEYSLADVHATIAPTAMIGVGGGKYRCEPCINTGRLTEFLPYYKYHE